MMRIVLTSVGTSLADKIQSYYAHKQDAINKDLLADTYQNFRAQNLVEFKEFIQEKQAITEGLLAHRHLENLTAKHRETADYVIGVLRYLWLASDKPEEFLRKYSPAELASLSLLSPRLGSDDEVRLLCSDTQESLTCGEIIRSVLTEWRDTSKLCGPDVTVPPLQILEGVQIHNADRLIDHGMPAWVKAIRTAQDELGPDDEVWVNVTGGYKGLAPLATLLAFCLNEASRPVKVVYLYEESTTLLTLPGSNLISFDHTLFTRFQPEWQQIPERGIRRVQLKGRPTFFSEVVDKRGDLIVQPASEVVQPTTTARLLLGLWRVSNNLPTPL